MRMHLLKRISFRSMIFLSVCNNNTMAGMSESVVVMYSFL